MTMNRSQHTAWLITVTKTGTFTVPAGLRRYWQARPGDPIGLAMEGDLLRLQPLGRPDRAVLARVLPDNAREAAS
jgi:hypothetical protein